MRKACAVKPMARICLVTHYFPPHVGGIEKVAFEQSKRLAKLGYRITVLTSKPHREDVDSAVEGVKILHYPSQGLAEKIGLPYPIPWFKAYPLFMAEIRKCDLVHAHGHPYLSSFLAYKVAKQFRKPFIVTQHNTFIDYDSWLNLAESLNDWTIGTTVLKNADRVIAVSGKTAEYVLRLGAGKEKTSVIYNGVDADFFQVMDKEKCRDKLDLPKNRAIILSIRRLVYKNGLNTLIEAASQMIKEHKDLLFILIGTGPDRGFIENRIRELNLSHNLKLTGFVPDEQLPYYYNAADCFVIPSSSGEGLPMVLLEAMSCGLPVVSTITGGTAEIIKEGVNGFLAPPRDPSALANAVSKALSQKTASSAIGRKNRKAIEKDFTWDKNLQKLHEIYEEFLNCKSV
jgi:glycosyltransferase involved in cell wall biosynthesis